MNTDYIWSKGFSQNNYYLYEHGIHVGELIHKKFGREAQVFCKFKRFILTTKGILNFKTTITDAGGKKIGDITYNLFNGSARIYYNNKTIKLKSNGFFDSRWVMLDGKNTLVKFNGSKHKGIIETENNDERLIICGLYITNIFWRLRSYLSFIAILLIWIQFVVAML